MKNTEIIQEEYAKTKGYESFQDLIEADINALDWHVSNVQKEYANEVTDYNRKLTSIQSIKRLSDGKIFSIGDRIIFSDRYPSFILDKIAFNAFERRIDLKGEGLFCSMLDSCC